MLPTEVKRALEDLIIDSVDFPLRLVQSSDFGFVLEDAAGDQFEVSVSGPGDPEDEDSCSWHPIE